MKTRMYSLYSKLISLCLLLLGFSGCGDSNGEDGGVFRVAYGTISAEYNYRVTGKVVSETSKEPIENIRVVMIEDESLIMPQRGDTVFTDSDGKFEVKRIYRYLWDKYKIKLKDMDGETNGSFEDMEESLKFTGSDFSQNYFGFEKDMGTMEMTPKRETEE